jgi:hypothetical protein
MHGDTACPERPKSRLVAKTEEAGSGVHYANHYDKCFQLTKVRRYCTLITRTIRPLLHKIPEMIKREGHH